MYNIIEKKNLSKNIYLMKIKAEALVEAAKPGQFLIVKIDEKGERIPLTICDYDKEEGSVTIVFQVLGESTKEMAKMEVGDFFADVLGPLGKESDLLHEEKKVLQKKKYLFVAGGVGTAPVYPQVKWMKQQDCFVDVIIGSKNKESLIFEEEMRKVATNVYVCTDDGSYGSKGLVTDKIQELVELGKKYDHAIIIGPMIMMKFAVEVCKQYGISTTVSLNPLMVDGTGMCGACRVSIGKEVKFACVDGPEFHGEEVNFDEALRRQRMYRTEEGRNILKLEDRENHHNPSCPNHEVVFVDRKKRIPVREQKPEERNQNFEEVCYGYSLEEAKLEASRCLQCKNPLCVQACPVSIDIPTFIREIKEDNLQAAADTIAKYSSLPAICGRVCPQESQCEGKCIVGIRGEAVSIGKLERFVGDWAIENKTSFCIPEKKQQKVAIVGGGPAGLTAAGDLAKKGYEVTIFEALHKLGGVLSYGIPEFRLPKEKIVEKEIENLLQLGVKVETNSLIGRTFTVDELLDKKGFSAVFIASGAGLPRFMNISGENLNGVISANEFLTRVNLMKAHQSTYATPVKIGKRVLVIGGGNVAMDAARTAKRLGAETKIVYRRSEKELPARLEEIQHAKEEGISFLFLSSPIEILGDENAWVKGVKCIRMKLGEMDESGRAAFSQVPNSEFIIEAENIIMALGTSPNPLILETTKDLQQNHRKGIATTSEFGETSRIGIFAGGDAVSGAATVILAMEAGKKAARKIDEYLQSML